MPGIRCIAQDRLQDFDRFKEHGLQALTDRSRRPVRYASHRSRSRADRPPQGRETLLGRALPAPRLSTLIDAALPVAIVGLQDADKVRHAGPISFIGRDWHLKIWCGLALPKPPHEIGNLLHGAHSERGA